MLCVNHDGCRTTNFRSYILPINDVTWMNSRAFCNIIKAYASLHVLVHFTMTILALCLKQFRKLHSIHTNEVCTMMSMCSIFWWYFSCSLPAFLLKIPVDIEGWLWIFSWWRLRFLIRKSSFRVRTCWPFSQML